MLVNRKTWVSNIKMGSRGSVEEGMNFLLGLLVLVVVAGFVFFMIMSMADKMEEQTTLETVDNLAYAMEYVCRNPGVESQTVEVRLPQKVGNAANWIAGFGDPKYIVYFERFPVGEEWSWTSIRVADPWMQLGTSAVVAVVSASVPYIGQLKKFGIVQKISSKISKTASKAAKWILSDGTDLTADALKNAVREPAQEAVGTLILREAGKKVDKPKQAILDELMKNYPDFSVTRAIFLKEYNDIYVERIVNQLDELAEAALRNGNSEIIDKAADLRVFTKNKIKDVDQINSLINDIDNIKADPAIRGTDIVDYLEAYKKELQDYYNFMSGPDNIAFFRAAAKLSRTTKFTQLPRNLILFTVAEKGKWIGQTYYFDALLSPFDRANEKFRYCGAGSLCVKTPNYVAVYPLKDCMAAGYNYVQLKIKGKPGSKPQDYFGGAMTFWFNIWTSGSKRFYLASPCGMEFKISKGKCKCAKTLETVYSANYVEDENGEWEWAFEPAGAARICDEVPESVMNNPNYAGSFEEYDCLIVENNERILDGYYGDNSPYNNFCYSRPENLQQITETAIIGASIALDLGITAASGGTAAPIVFGAEVANSMFWDQALAATARDLLWPKGG